MLENFELIISLGCWHGVEDEGSCSKQNASVEGVSQVRILSAHPSTQKTDTCDMCAPLLKDILHLDEHQGTHPNMNPYTCGACGRGFWFSAHLAQQQKEHTGEESFRWDKDRDSFLKSSVVCLSEKPFTCIECGKDVSDSRDLLQHLTINSGGKPHGSIECREAFPPNSNLGKLLTCSDCGGDFRNSSAFFTHLRTNSEEVPFRCLRVGNSLEEKSTLVNYQKKKKKKKSHPVDTSHVCQDCGKAFSHPCKLMKLQKFHTGVKYYECSDCGKTFGHKVTLVHHQRIHIGERPYECRECGKAFNNRSHLTWHEKVHTGEWPFECSKCGRAFSQSSNFLRHQKVHTQVRPYECNQCGKAFGCSSTLI